ncbi:MAG: two-component system response regulator [Chthoniobacterales bacterium]|nr:two-component system response regulator [Chthoniobacterales bacterium]
MEPDTSPAKPVILVVDDTPDNLALMSELLRERYTVKLAKSGERGLQLAAADPPPDLILLDIMMPGLSGYDVMRRLKADERTRHIPVIFLTAMSAVEDEKRGLEMGAVDYITKPISPPIVLARVANHLHLKEAADFLRDKSIFLEQEVQKRTRENLAIQNVTILALASLAETRDSETGYHIRRTQHYIRILAEQLRHHPRFGWYLTDENIAELYRSAPLHDIGKVGIPDHVLLKQTPLTPEEYEVMKKHTVLGRDAIQSAEDQLGMPVDFLKTAKEIAYYHQEWWNGAGYPTGAKGEDIPVSARLMAVADVYDALISKRNYKEAMTHEDAAKAIRDGRGTHFDPDVVDAFFATQDQFREVAARFGDAGAKP